MKKFKNMKNIGRESRLGKNPWLPDPRSSIILTMATLTAFLYYSTV